MIHVSHIPFIFADMRYVMADFAEMACDSVELYMLCIFDYSLEKRIIEDTLNRDSALPHAIMLCGIGLATAV